MGLPGSEREYIAGGDKLIFLWPLLVSLYVQCDKSKYGLKLLSMVSTGNTQKLIQIKLLFENKHSSIHSCSASYFLTRQGCFLYLH